MEFNIVSFNPASGQIVVEVGEMRLALDLPIDDEGCVPEGEALERFVMGFIPEELLRRRRLLAQYGGVRNAEAIQRLVAAPMSEVSPATPADFYLQGVNLSSL